ncbi:MAG: type II secretion system protein [Verrucomicrobiaceae bacterium]
MKSSATQTGEHHEQHRDTAIDAKNVLLIKPFIITRGVLSAPATSMNLPTHRHPPKHMKTPSSNHSPHGFTLVELLVVVTIIGILAGLVISQAPKLMQQSRELEVRNVIVSLQTGIRNYQTEYNRFPLDPAQLSSGDEDAPAVLTNQSTTLIDTLMGPAASQSSGGGSSSGSGSGATADLNPKGIEFTSFKVAKAGRNGLVGTQSPYSLVDLWGSPFYILFDTNLDRKIKNPDLQNQDPKISQNAISPPPQFLPTDVAIYSLGKDRIPMTGDDIVSWRN